MNFIGALYIMKRSKVPVCARCAFDVPAQGRYQGMFMRALARVVNMLQG